MAPSHVFFPPSPTTHKVEQLTRASSSKARRAKQSKQEKYMPSKSTLNKWKTLFKPFAEERGLQPKTSSRQEVDAAVEKWFPTVQTKGGRPR